MPLLCLRRVNRCNARLALPARHTTAPAMGSYPSFPRRIASLCYECFLVSGVLAFAFLLPHALIGYFLHRLATPPILWAHLFVVLLVYFVGFWSCRGQTLAMRTWRIRLTRRDGGAVTPLRALGRYLLCWPSLGCGGLGLLWALVDPERQFLHDRIAGTRLVHAVVPSNR